MTPICRSNLIPPLLRPHIYTGKQGHRNHTEWLADAIIAYREANKVVSHSDQLPLGL